MFAPVSKVSHRARAAQPRAVVNGASFEPGLVPGSLATVFVPGVLDEETVVTAAGLPLPASLNGVTVLVDGQPAPVLAIANRNGLEQVNFQAPPALVPGASAAVRVRREGVFETGVVAALVRAAQPGIFLLSGAEAIVVHHAGNTLVTEEQPLRAGEFAYFYATGLGAVDNEPGAGAAAPPSPLARALADVTVTLGGVPCEVLFAGLAPGYAGVFQINIRVPAAAPSGRQELRLDAAGVTSPPAAVFVE